MLRIVFISLCLPIMLTTYLVGYELSIATIFCNEAPYLKEWIDYHTSVGVDHFLLYNDKSTDNWKEILKPYIDSKTVDVIDWPVPSMQHFIECQRNAYKDALKRLSGVSKWVALIDCDEFILPMQEKTVTECLAKHFSTASAVYVQWHHFGTNNTTLKQGESMLMKLTACARPNHPKNLIGKSIVKPECTDPDKLWNTHHIILKSDAHYCNGDGQRLHFIGPELQLDRKNHKQFIRLNHYYTRDEHFFHNTRLKRIREIGIPEWLVWQHHHDFNKRQDYAITDLINAKNSQAETAKK